MLLTLTSMPTLQYSSLPSQTCGQSPCTLTLAASVVLGLPNLFIRCFTCNCGASWVMAKLRAGI